MTSMHRSARLRAFPPPLVAAVACLAALAGCGGSGVSAGASGAAVAQSSSVGSLTVVGTLDSTDVAPSTITIVPDPAQTGPAEAGSTTWVDGPLIPNAAAPTSIAAAAESIGLSLDLPPLPGPDRIEVNEAPMPVERRAMAARRGSALAPI